MSDACSFPTLSRGFLLGFDVKLYVATCSPARDSGAGYVDWGHSTLVGPFGEVLATTEHDEAIVIAEIDYSVIETRRTYLPFGKQRRGDLYQLVDVQQQNSATKKLKILLGPAKGFLLEDVTLDPKS